MGEVDIQLLLKLNSDFNLSFNDNKLIQYLSSVYCKLQLSKSADFAYLQKMISLWYCTSANIISLL